MIRPDQKPWAVWIVQAPNLKAEETEKETIDTILEKSQEIAQPFDGLAETGKPGEDFRNTKNIE